MKDRDQIAASKAGRLRHRGSLRPELERTQLRRKKGFSLTELLIVIAIILVIAAIAIPHLLRSRIASNEASAVGSLRTINSAMIQYYLSHPAVGYAGGLGVLGASPCVPSATRACLIDGGLAGGTRAVMSSRSRDPLVLRPIRTMRRLCRSTST